MLSICPHFEEEGVYRRSSYKDGASRISSTPLLLRQDFAYDKSKTNVSYALEDAFQKWEIKNYVSFRTCFLTQISQLVSSYLLQF